MRVGEERLPPVGAKAVVDVPTRISMVVVPFVPVMVMNAVEVAPENGFCCANKVVEASLNAPVISENEPPLNVCPLLNPPKIGDSVSEERRLIFCFAVPLYSSS